MTAEQLDLYAPLPDSDNCHTCGQPADVRLHTETNLLLRNAARHWPGHSAGIPLCHDHTGTHGDHPHVPHWVSYIRPLTPGQAPPNCPRPWTVDEPDETQLRSFCGPRRPRPTHTVPITGSYL